ncbi:MAG: type III pantothenate kinase [Firmicutes bacterium]|nr:type III pantothenate kinase [Bacillota bacterium]
MVLLIDVGNTEIRIGVHDKSGLVGSWRMTTDSLKTSDELGGAILRFVKFDEIDPKKIEGAIICSVVPNIMYSLTRGVKKYFGTEPVIVSCEFDSGITLNMPNPKELGTDRLVRLAAGYAIYGGPIMIIDYGTATTFDVLDKNGNFLTGITAPGVNICAEALFTNTAQLPKIEIKRPDSIYCRDIVSCIQSGIYYGHVGEARYIIENVKKELDMPEMKIVATGGMAREIGGESGIFDIFDPLLAFKGLYIIYQRNAKTIGGHIYAAGH